MGSTPTRVSKVNPLTLQVMLYYNFNGFEGFKERFGIIEHGNGNKSRRNKILLHYVKQPELLRRAVKTGDFTEINISSMTSLWRVLAAKIGRHDYNFCQTRKFNQCTLAGVNLSSTRYRLDELDGVCEDGSVSMVRYVSLRDNRVYKMKAGKFFNSCLEDMGLADKWPEPVRLWLCEEFARLWEVESSQSRISRTGELELVVDDDFRSIYSSDCYYRCDGGFGSCMVNDGQYYFYSRSVNAKAASLRRKVDGLIVARCVIFTDVTDENGDTWRLGERQYAAGEDECLKRLLVDALIKGDYIDAYKKVGVDCHSNRSYVSVDGEDLYDKKFRISCKLHGGDILSYQDSFVYFDEENQIAYNYEENGTDRVLDETDYTYDGMNYDSWNRRYTRDDLYEVYADGERYETDYDTRENDFEYVDAFDAYYHRDECHACPYCHSAILDTPEKYGLSYETYHSEITGEDYCRERCRRYAEDDYKANNWTYSEYDDVYVEDEYEVTTYRRWSGDHYYDYTILKSSLLKLVNLGEVILCAGQYYQLPYTPNIEYTLVHGCRGDYFDYFWYADYND